MENKNIIIILIVIIAILAAAIGVMLLNPATAKQPSVINVTSDSEQYECGELSIQLTDLNRTPISKEIVNITVTNETGSVVVDDVVKTDLEGNATMDLDLKQGKYNVTVSYGGNENYTANNTTQKLTIKEEVKAVETSNSNSAQTDYNSPDSDYYKWDTDGSYHKKQPGAKYIYAQDAVTGEWSYWADKSQ